MGGLPLPRVLQHLDRVARTGRAPAAGEQAVQAPQQRRRPYQQGLAGVRAEPGDEQGNMPVDQHHLLQRLVGDPYVRHAQRAA